MIWPTFSRAATFVLLVASVPAAWAQSTPAPAPPSAPQAPAATTTPDPTAGLPPGCMADSASGKRYCPGWLVEVVTLADNQSIPVGRFASENSGRATMKDHEKSVNFDPQDIGYRGTSFLNASQDGQYTFLFELDRGGSANRCSFTFFIGNDPIVREKGFKTKNAAGARSLQAGLHPVAYELFCRRSDIASQRASQVPAVAFRILPPGENFPREVRSSDILYELPPT
jgi:hypothetical protein